MKGKGSKGVPVELDTAALTALENNPGEVANLDVRAAEVADVLATSGLLPQPQATADALRLLARTRPGRTAGRWSVS